MKHIFQISLATLFILSGCSRSSSDDLNPKVSSITIVDTNGFTETITSKDRLQQYERVDFSKPQSFQKVLRVYGRDSTGNVNAILTSYHPNGQLKELLEAKNNSAYGSYTEWFPSGQKKLQANVISGTADLTTPAKQSWLFDGTSTVWSEDGSLAATIEYSKGILDGTSLYYHPSGKLWKRIPYQRGLVCGQHSVFLDNGDCLQQISYLEGIKHGTSIRYWSPGNIASEEHYTNGLLITGNYHAKDGKTVAQIKNGDGSRALFGFNNIAELQEYRHGTQEGQVKTFDNDGNLIATYHVKNGIKHGEEIEYFEKKLGQHTVKPRLMLTWFEGCIQGIVKTWYDSGMLENQREMSRNQKSGLSMAWYRDGSLMMIEEYDRDTLVRGEYFKVGDKTPLSQVWDGNGIATLFDAEGNFSRKVTYYNGKPIE